MVKTGLFLISVLLVLSSCVSQKKYDDLLASNKRLENRIERLEEVRKSYDALVGEHQQLSRERESLLQEKANLEQHLNGLKNANAELQAEYDEVLNQNRNILASATQDRQSLIEELGKKENEIAQTERRLGRLESELNHKEASLEELQRSLKEREKRINELTSQINAQQNALNDLMVGLNSALLGFSDSELSVSKKNGRVYVSLSQELLFAVGSDVIDSKGREAIIKLAEVLKQNPDVAINVEGHTDSDGSADRNWDLSVSRATAVVKILTRSGVDPKRITASGRALYDPVAPNDSPTNKSLNRRTEIILSPDFEKLYQLISN
jgi:chemotaxis protein MotB